MNHFKPKSLIFYAVAIGSVVVLFNRVTAYGNSHLKASQNIEGHYPIQAENLPECLKSGTLALKLEQSGIYLVAALTKNQPNSAPSSQEKLSLTGERQGENLSLAGPVTDRACPKDSRVAIAGSLNQETLSGQLTVNSEPPVKFTARRQTEVQPNTSNPNH